MNAGFSPRTMIQNRKKHRINSYPIIHFSTSEEVSERSEQSGASEHMSGASGASKWTGEWLSTSVCIFGCSSPQCFVVKRPFPPTLRRFNYTLFFYLICYILIIIYSHSLNQATTIICAVLSWIVLFSIGLNYLFHSLFSYTLIFDLTIMFRFVDLYSWKSLKTKCAVSF